MIRVYSEPGAGTTFKAYLPTVERGVAGEAGPSESPPPWGTETILVAEDDAAVAAVTRSILEGAGYTVVIADNGAEAVRLFQERPEAFDLLLFDCVMPEMGGRKAREAIRRCRPTVRVLFCSGYDARDARPGAVAGVTDDPIIEKPYSPAALLRRVRELLDEPRGILDASKEPR
jgi:CheY-like chemotaxis protein